MSSVMQPAERSDIENRVISALKTVYDPEIPVDIWELGLVYGMQIDEARRYAKISMTLTAPACPVAGSMPEWVQNAVRGVEGIDDVDVELVWEPPWNQEMISPRARLELNLL
ncbi:DUF59 domain-containing protein [Plasticicumulans acidivorans]|uniref:FeS assembly SUF system protein n=1 Tax=Plasticicumulans acidivorans TaxID=886464 RepID=A0A317MS80_9GAMM|nr:DUF59 domain-containing protein [Plasticicumulans acidivorans]PWV58896.1 FeS assembly SUF system protein [Plasticicumulans acidivorans]